MNPLRKFKIWFEAAKKDYPFDHTAFNLSTSYKNRPYSRMVLLKILQDGFIFLLISIAIKVNILHLITHFLCVFTGRI